VGQIVPSMPGYSFTPGRRACDPRHNTDQNFTAVPQGQGSVREGSGEPGAGSGTANPAAVSHPKASQVILKAPSKLFP
jgi:hypothetical protein